MSNSSTRSGYGLAFLAVLSFSTGALFLIWADPISAYEKTFVRLLVGTITMWVIGLTQGNRFRYSWRDLGQFLLIGCVMAIHLGAFVMSLKFTTIAHAMTITHTGAISTLVCSAIFLKETIPRAKLIGVLVTVIGVAIMTGMEPMWTSRMLIGDGFALITALTMGIYSVWGRAKRDAFSLSTYMVGLYGMATLWVLPLGWANFAPDLYTPTNVIAMIAAGVVPIGLGHTFFTAAVRRVHAAYVSLIATQAVTGSVLLGALFLGQVPATSTAIGAGIALVGVLIVLR